MGATLSVTVDPYVPPIMIAAEEEVLTEAGAVAPMSSNQFKTQVNTKAH